MNNQFEIQLVNKQGVFGTVDFSDTFNRACEIASKRNSEKDSDDYWYVVYKRHGFEQLYP